MTSSISVVALSVGNALLRYDEYELMVTPQYVLTGCHSFSFGPRNLFTLDRVVPYLVIKHQINGNLKTATVSLYRIKSIYSIVKY